MKTILLGLIFTFLSLNCISVSSDKDRDSSERQDYPLGIRNITVVVEDGDRVSMAVIEFNRTIKNKGLSKDSFEVEGYEATRIYANNNGDKDSEGKDGNYIIIELDKNKGKSFSEDSKLRIIQKEAVIFSNGERYRILDKVLISNRTLLKY